MMLSAHFDDSEFFTASSGTPTQRQRENAAELCASVLEPVRQEFGRPIRVNSGMRSLVHNLSIGGAPTSEHLYRGDSAAADIDAGDDAGNRELFALLLKRQAHIGQLIVYVTKAGIVEWIHVSKKSTLHPTPQVLCATAEKPSRYAVFITDIKRP